MPTKVPVAVAARFLRLAVVVLLAGGVMLLAGHWEMVRPGVVQAWVERAGMLGPIVFVLLFAASAVLFVPGTVMTLAGGALFGPWLGTFYNITGSTLGAVAAFLISRYLARDWAERRAGRRLRLVMTGVREEGWKFVLAVRLAGVPYFVLNYMLGLTPVGVVPYAVASFFGMLPAIAAMTYAGYIGFEAIDGGEGMLGKLIAAIALIGLAALIPVVFRILTRKTSRVRRGDPD